MVACCTLKVVSDVNGVHRSSVGYLKSKAQWYGRPVYRAGGSPDEESFVRPHITQAFRSQCLVCDESSLWCESTGRKATSTGSSGSKEASGRGCGIGYHDDVEFSAPEAQKRSQSEITLRCTHRQASTGACPRASIRSTQRVHRVSSQLSLVFAAHIHRKTTSSSRATPDSNQQTGKGIAGGGGKGNTFWVCQPSLYW